MSRSRTLHSDASEAQTRNPSAWSLAIYHRATVLPTSKLIKDKLTELIEQTLYREGSLYLACNEKRDFVTSEQTKIYHLW